MVTDPWAGLLTKREALDLFWDMARRIAPQVRAVRRQIRELRELQRYISRRWGRAPQLPQW